MVYEAVAKLRKLAGKRMMKTWQAGGHTWFDHRIDEMMWPDNIFWVERGALARLYLPKGGKVLDVCCGDGYFSDLFWSISAERVDAVDRDPRALAQAARSHGHRNIAFHKRDIVRDPLPDSQYDLVCFFEAIEHLSAEDGQVVLRKLRSALADGGHIVGSTTQVAHDARGMGNPEHDNEFESAEDLAAFLGPDATILTSYHPARTTLYFILGSGPK